MSFNLRLTSFLDVILRLKQRDDDYRRGLIYQQVNQARLQQARKVLETEKQQREDEERILRLEQEMKMVGNLGG